MPTQVVNIRNDECDVKITRTRKNEVPEPPAFGCFGNPFTVGDYGRDGAIKMFKAYFYKRIEEDQAFRQAVLSLRGKRLGCFCKPLDCHGDIIAAWLDNQPPPDIS